MNDWQVRPSTMADDPFLVAIVNQVSLLPLSLDEYRRRNDARTQDGPFIRLVVDGPESTPVGYGRLIHNPWRPAEELEIQVAVDPAARNQGVGSCLYAALERQALQWGGRALGTYVRDDLPEGRSFAERRGFTVTDHSFRSRQDLATFDPAPFRHYVTDARAQGYRLLTLAETDQAEGWRRLYELDMDCSRDEPGMAHAERPTFEQYTREIFDAIGCDPAGIFIAEKAGAFVAVSGLQFPPGLDTAWVFFTGVRREHRGKGLAQALKLLAAEYAREKGRRYIGTGNHENNPAMLAINRKFGYQPQPGSYAMHKRLAR